MGALVEPNGSLPLSRQRGLAVTHDRERKEAAREKAKSERAESRREPVVGESLGHVGNRALLSMLDSPALQRKGQDMESDSAAEHAADRAADAVVSGQPASVRTAVQGPVLQRQEDGDTDKRAP